MNDPRADIRALRIKNCQGRYFVPESPYLTYMAPEIIRGALLRCGTEPWKLDELVTVITEGAKRIIGILILIRQEKTFIKFVEEHQGETRTMDAQLPFTRDKLSFLEPDMAEEFVETQWMFIAPTFAPRLTHRFFDDDTVLPFVEDLSLDEGGFGRVFLVKVHAGYHRYTGAEYGSQSQVSDLALICHCFVKLILLLGLSIGTQRTRHSSDTNLSATTAILQSAGQGRTYCLVAS
jgi:hypothetical protein